MVESAGELPRWLWGLLLGSFLSTVGSLVEVFLTLYLVEQATLGRHGGTARGTQRVGIIGGNLLGGGIGDRIGLRLTLLWSTTASILLLVAVPVTPPAALGAVLFALGLAQGVYRPVSAAIVMAALPADARRQGVAWLRVSWNAGFVIGPPLGALVAAWNFDLIFVVEAVTAVFLLVSVMVIPRRPGPVSEPGVPRSTWSALRADPRMVLLLATILLVDTSYRFAYTAMPLQLRALDAPTWVYGLTISVNGIVIVLLEPWLARRLRHIAAIRLLSWGFALVGAGWALLIPLPGVAVAFLAVLVVTMGEMLYKPTATAHAADRAPVGMYGRYQSLYAAASISGTFTAPAIVGGVFPIDHRLTWVVGAALCGAAAGFLLLWSRLPPGIERTEPASQTG